MQSYEFFSQQKAFDIIEVTSPDGSHTRKIGLIGILSNSPSLYRQNAFGGAKIDDPYQTMAIYKEKLEKDLGVDLVIPICHLYVPQDEVTCKTFDFPVILSGHDHHVVNQVIDDTLLLKAGSDAENAVVLDITWTSSQKSQKPEIRAKIEKCSNYPADEKMVREVQECYSVLDHLKHTELSPIPPAFLPLSSAQSREKIVTLASFLWTELKSALNQADSDEPTVECVILNGGEIRGSKVYPPDSFFSLSDLRSEIAEQLETIIVSIPGNVLNAAIKETHTGPNPGFIQTDAGVKFDHQENILSINGSDFDPNRLYKGSLILRPPFPSVTLSK